MSFPSQCFKHYSLLCLRHLFDPKWFYWKYRNSFELICHTCSALPPLGENVYLYLCICVLICCICVSVFVVFVFLYLLYLWLCMYLHLVICHTCSALPPLSIYICVIVLCNCFCVFLSIYLYFGVFVFAHLSHLFSLPTLWVQIC